MQHEVILAGGPWGLPLNIPLLPGLMQGLGYITHMVGKWHLGHHHKEYTPTYRKILFISKKKKIIGSREEDEVSGFFVLSHLWMRGYFRLG